MMERDNIELIAVLRTAMTERLNDPKNVSKGDWCELYTEEMIDKLYEEIDEVKIELPASKSFTGLSIRRLHAIRYELADLAVVCGFLIQRIESVMESHV